MADEQQRARWEQVGSSAAWLRGVVSGVRGTSSWMAARLAPSRIVARIRAVSLATWLEAGAAAAIFLYGLLLRFEAVYRTYGPVLGSQRFVDLQHRMAELAAILRPARFRYPPGGEYWGDPRGYLGLARATENFYEASVREPLFVFGTKLSLLLTNGQDIAVSLTSAFSSGLMVLATYALGRIVGGRSVGLTAAFLVAIERQIVWWGKEGFRDDLFAALTVLFAFACLWLLRRPSAGSVALVGISGGLACLTRITGLAFVVPALAVLVVARGRSSWRESGRYVLLAAVVTLAILGPFLISCWIEYGDPLYTINTHTNFYRGRAGLSSDEYMSVSDYLLMQVRTAPARTIDTAFRGFTIFPWSSKWRGFRPWSRWLATALSWLSVIGVLSWLWSGKGRLLLLIMAGTLLPYAFTYEIQGGAQGRFTLPFYPLLITAAVVACALPVGWVREAVATRSGWLAWLRARRLQLAGTAGVVVLYGVTLNLLPVWVVFDELWRGRAASVTAGPQDAFFFRGDWAASEEIGNINVRPVKEDSGTIYVPMLGDRPYRALLRIDPVPRPGSGPTVVEASLNGVTLERLVLTLDPGRIGSYELSIPADLARSGINRFELELERWRISRKPGEREDPDDRPAFKVWYVRLYPNPG